MHSTMIQQAGSSAGGPARAPSASEVQAIDAQIELAAKKAALRGLEAQAEGGAAAIPAAPPPPGTSRTTIVLEKDGKTTVLENPTAEQLRQAGIGSTEVPSWRPDWQQVSIVGSLVFGVVAVLYLFLAPRRRFPWSSPDAGPSRAMEDRMSRIENAIETVAVEVERISEGQRFAARQLSEGAAQPVNGAASVPENVSAVLQNRGGG